MHGKKFEELAKGKTREQVKTMMRYKSFVKLKAVLRWRERMVRANLTVLKLARAIGKPSPRLSEWINLKKQPTDANFHAVESILYSLGK